MPEAEICITGRVVLFLYIDKLLRAGRYCTEAIILYQHDITN